MESAQIVGFQGFEAVDANGDRGRRPPITQMLILL